MLSPAYIKSKERVHELKNEIQKHNSKIPGFEKEIKELSKSERMKEMEIEKIENSLKEKKKELSRIRTKKNAVTKKNDESQQKIEEATREISGLEILMSKTKTFIIFVSKQFESVNGMVGLNRDILLRIVAQIRAIEKVRPIFGTCHQIYAWIKQDAFKYIIRTFRNVPRLLKGNFYDKQPGYSIDGLIVKFNAEKNRTILFRDIITHGIWILTVKVSNFEFFSGYFNIGVCHSNNTYNVYNHPIGDYTGSVSFSMMSNHACILTGVEKSQHRPLPDLRIAPQPEHTLTLQADMTAGESKTLHVFLDNALVPGFVRKISDSIRFGFSSSGAHVVRCVELRRIPRTLVDKRTEKACKIFYYAGYASERPMPGFFGFF